MAAIAGILNSQATNNSDLHGYVLEALTAQVASLVNPAWVASSGAPAVASNGTIATAGLNVSRVTPAAAVTGVILAAGTVTATPLVVVNEAIAARSITFDVVGTSNVDGGVSVIIPGKAAMLFVWDGGTSTWLPAGFQSVFAGAITPAGGVAVAAGTGPTVFHSGSHAPDTATSGTDTTPSVTESYVCEVFIPANASITGVSLLNGSAVAGNVTVYLADSAGVNLAHSASTAQSGTAAYQQIGFTAPYAAVGPGKFYIVAQFNNTSARFRSHAVGNFGAGKHTTDTYGTFPVAGSNPTTFTTNLGPIADTY